MHGHDCYMYPNLCAVCVFQAAVDPEVVQVGVVEATQESGFLFTYKEPFTETEVWPGKDRELR